MLVFRKPDVSAKLWRASPLDNLKADRGEGMDRRILWVVVGTIAVVLAYAATVRQLDAQTEAKFGEHAHRVAAVAARGPSSYRQTGQTYRRATSEERSAQANEVRSVFEGAQESALRLRSPVKRELALKWLNAAREQYRANDSAESHRIFNDYIAICATMRTSDLLLVKEQLTPRQEWFLNWCEAKRKKDRVEARQEALDKEAHQKALKAEDLWAGLLAVAPGIGKKK
jgi:hypothetical protein